MKPAAGSRSPDATVSRCASDVDARATTARPSATGILGLDAFGGFGYTRYVREDLAVTISVDSFGVDSGASVGPNGVGAGNVGGLAVPIGIRWNPIKGDHRRQSLKPFLALGVGPVVGIAEGSFVGKTISSGTVTRSTVGGQFGGGFDVHLARSVSLGVTVVYNADGRTSRSRSACATTTTASRWRSASAGSLGKGNNGVSSRPT